MNATTIAPQIADFAAAVRAALADLPEEERDELTEGLEADLSEAYAEDLARELPDPVEYAAELRAAAGLPDRDDEPTRIGWMRGIADAWAHTRRDVVVAVRRNPAAVSVLDFLGTLRPVWWVARAWVATWLLSAMFGSERGFVPTSPFWVLVLVALTVVSVQWGRGRWAFRGLGPLVVIGNLAALVLVLPAVAAASSFSGVYYGDDDYSNGYAEAQQNFAAQGLSYRGTALENVYAYDAKGRPLQGVQLFDVDGNPLQIRNSPEMNNLDQESVRLETGETVFNVFPLSLIPMTFDEYGDPVEDTHADPDKSAAYRDGPFVKVPAVDGAGEPKKVSRDND